ncbi:Nucleoporin, Nup85-like protein [Meredithblackwellia eburnea MCA 4105]
MVALQPHFKLNKTSQLNAAFSPLANTVAVVASPSNQVQPQQKGLPPALRAAYFVQYEGKQLETRDLIVKSYTFWASLQSIAKEYEEADQDFGNYAYRQDALPPPPPETRIKYFNRISTLFREELISQLAAIEADSALSSATKTKLLQHHASLHSILSLNEIIYVSPSGGIVGEELLDWLNTVDRAPAAEEGEELVSLGSPWESDNFWPYVYRCILRGHLRSATTLLTLLTTSHPSPEVQSLSKIPLGLISTFPRSTNFQTERDFLSTVRDWKRSAQISWREFEDQGEGVEEVEVEDLSILMKLVLGEEEIVLERSEEWREAVAAWGVWVNPGLRRDGLDDVVKRVTQTLPIDSTLTEETILSSLMSGDVVRALQQSNMISLWLVAHLSDLLDKVGALPTSTSPPPNSLVPLLPHQELFSSSTASFSIPPPTPEEQSLRNYFTLSYTDALLADPGLWRIILDYLSSCGFEGRERMRRVVLSVRLDGVGLDDNKDREGKGKQVDVMDEDGKENKEPRTSTSRAEEVIQACVDHGLDEEMRKVCKIFAEQLICNKEYGAAIAFCVRAGDSKRVARIASRVLEEYIVNGQEAFIAHVDSIPTSLLRPQASSRSSSPMSTGDNFDNDPLAASLPYSSRLTFLARYRDFFALYAREERREAAQLLVLLLTSRIAPIGFWAVMLLDVVPLLDTPDIFVSLEETYELLQILEELTGPITASGGKKDIYGNLESLARVVSGSSAAGPGTITDKVEATKRAMKQLDVVRAALARHLGRCCCL